MHFVPFSPSGLIRVVAKDGIVEQAYITSSRNWWQLSDINVADLLSVGTVAGLALGRKA